ncbi:MAG: GntR family transcriptional regulator [Pseudomonadota bacterium]
MQDASVASRGEQAQTVARTLRTEIVNGSIAPGIRLGQDDLARRFGISRMPVREALRLLQSEGLVELPPNRSAIVAEIDVDDMVDIFDMRVALETLAIRLAIPHLTNAQIDAASVVQREMETAEQGDYGRLNAELHRLLYAPCRRQRLLTEIQRLAGHADRYLRLALNAPQQRQDSDAEHRVLVDACYARQAEVAVEIMEKHIGQARDRLRDLMVSGPAGGAG